MKGQTRFCSCPPSPSLPPPSSCPASALLTGVASPSPTLSSRMEPKHRCWCHPGSRSQLQVPSQVPFPSPSCPTPSPPPPALFPSFSVHIFLCPPPSSLAPFSPPLPLTALTLLILLSFRLHLWPWHATSLHRPPEFVLLPGAGTSFPSPSSSVPVFSE